MWGWERSRLMGKGYAREEKSSIVPIVTVLKYHSLRPIFDFSNIERRMPR